MENKSLIPELPEEIRAARIGTCYNPFTRKLMINKIVIDPTKLDAKAIDMTKGKGELRLRANASTSKNTNDAFFALDSNAKIGSWVSLGFSMSEAASEAKSSNSLNCYCSYVYSGQKLRLIYHGDETLFQYMTKEFQDAYTNLVQADEKDKLDRYKEFIGKFGYGCVTELYLTSGSAFEISAHYSDQAKANEAKYNARIGVGNSWGGGSVAANYAQKVEQVDSNATVELRASQLPEDTPTKSWCADMLNTIGSHAFSVLSKNPTLVAPYKGEMPKAPDIPQGRPDTNKLPDGNAPEFTDDLQKQLMKEDGFTGKWEEYESKQKELYDKLTAQNVVRETQKNRSMILNRMVDEGVKLGDVMNKKDSGQINAALDSGSSWNLGGYIPYKYEFKLWHELFPNLKTVMQFQSLTTQYLSKAYMFYMTRLQFASYLSLLADISFYVTNNGMAKQDYAQFSQTCDDLIADINSRMRYGKSFGEKDYNAIIARFEQSIENLEEFRSNKIYNIFFNNYDFFIENLCGLVVAYVEEGAKADSWTYFTCKMRIPQETTRRMELSEMMENGQRFYAVITPEGNLRLTTYARWKNISSWYSLPDLPGGFKAIKKRDRHNYTYYNYKNPFPEWPHDRDKTNMKPRLYGAGASILKVMEGFELAGVPMIQPLDFELIRSFANPASGSNL